jgi:putative hemolysin
MEDLIEELLGDITDEYDVVKEEKQMLHGDQVIDGLTSLDDFADQTGLVLPEGPYDTVAGYVIAQLGQVPTLDATVQTIVHAADNDQETVKLVLRVTELDGRRAASLAVRRLEPGPAEAATQSTSANGPAHPIES